MREKHDCLALAVIPSLLLFIDLARYSQHVGPQAVPSDDLFVTVRAQTTWSASVRGELDHTQVTDGPQASETQSLRRKGSEKEVRQWGAFHVRRWVNWSKSGVHGRTCVLWHMWCVVRTMKVT